MTAKRAFLVAFGAAAIVAFIVEGIVLLTPIPVCAGTVCDQGAGTTALQEWTVVVGARRGAANSQVLVSSSIATAVPATPLAARKSMEIQNLGPNQIYCTADGQTPTAALGRRIDSFGTWSLDVGPRVIVSCLAATATQLSGAATQVTELK